jgi:threonine dehydrogenase-like Zn-dependent dehydrogenase
VIGIDPREECRALATDFGAEWTFTTDDDGTTDRITDVLEMTAGAGADFVFESTGRPQIIDAGIQMCRPFGCFVWQGNYGDGPIAFEFLQAHQRRLRMVFPCDDGYRPYRRASLHAIASGAMPWDKVITHRISYHEAPTFYEELFQGTEANVIGSVINWESAE